MKHLIIGNGEIGKSLKKIFNCEIIDKDSRLKGEYDVLHIAYPYSLFFTEITEDYKEKYNAKYVVVHSTVPVGTCNESGFIHSPVTGVHPTLKESIMTFTKFVSDKEMAEEFKSYGIPAVYVENPSNTEAGKLFNLLVYGINVLLEKEIYKYCEDNNLDYDVVYRQFVEMYNHGYEAMGMSHNKMYELQHRDGGIGGHCVLQNSPMLNTDFSKILEELNNSHML